jgi:hypothetical protein
MAEDPLEVDTLIQVEHAADEARRTGDEDMVPEAVRQAYEAGNGVEEIARVTQLPVDQVLELLGLDR